MTKEPSDIKLNEEWIDDEGLVVLITNKDDEEVYYMKRGNGRNVFVLSIENFLLLYKPVRKTIKEKAAAIVEELDYDMYKEMFLNEPHLGDEFTEWLERLMNE